MKVSYAWLTELVPSLALGPDEVANILTRHSFEVVVARCFAIDAAVTTAQITQLAPHPNADRLQLATLDTGGGESVTVVCGAPNIAVGDIVPYAAPGAELRDEAGHAFTLREATIRGHASPGMLTSLRELGLAEQHAGIYILPPDTPLNTPLNELMPADTVLEADITPNRAHDCMSHIGIARELAALLDTPVDEPRSNPLPTEPPPGWEVTVTDPHDTPRYLGIPITGVTVAPAPLWLQARLLALGQRPINNVVDITNYIMFEQGNPLHAFAADKLPGRHITIRAAAPGEIITTLDGAQHALQPRHLVIASNGTAIALAGIMGGVSSEVDSSTQEIFLEGANFRAFTIQQASGELRLITESSKRFARRLPPVTAAAAVARAATLLQELAGGTPSGIIDHYPAPAPRTAIPFRPDRVSRIAGYPSAAAEDIAILRRLRCEVVEQADGCFVTPPADRLDITGEHDLVEEVVRLRGLDEIPSPPLAAAAALPLPPTVALRDWLRDYLVAAGFTEVYNRPFEHLQIARTLAVNMQSAVAVANPIGPEQAHLRVSLLPRVIENLLTNKGEVRLKRSSRSRNLFEISTIWRAGEGGRVPGVVEEEHLAGVIVDGQDAAGLVRDMLRELGIDSHVSLGISAGPLPPQALAVLKLPLGLQYFDLHLGSLLQHVPQDFTYAPASPTNELRYRPVSKYPPAYRDISLLVAPGTAVEDVQEIIARAGGAIVADVDLFDVYDDEANTSYAFHIKYQAADHTLAEAEIEAAHQRIATALQEEVGAEIR